MKLTEKEEKIARLALDKAAQPGERQAAAAKLIESLYVRGVSVEDIEKESVPIEYRDRVQTQTVYGDRPVPRRSRRSSALCRECSRLRRQKRAKMRAGAACRCWKRASRSSVKELRSAIKGYSAVPLLSKSTGAQLSLMSA